VAESESTVNYWMQFIILVLFAIFVALKIQEVWKARKVRRFLTQPQERYAPQPTVLLTPPPTPIDRNEFLQARMAYVAHLRDVGIEVDEGQDRGDKLPSGKRIVRPAKPEEMIELVNLRDADHVDQVFATWDEVQVKQRGKL
jgi:hypothetical protein